MSTNTNTVNALQSLFTALETSRFIFQMNEDDIQVLAEQAGMDCEAVCEGIFDNISDAMEIIYGVLASVDEEFTY